MAVIIAYGVHVLLCLLSVFIQEERVAVLGLYQLISSQRQISALTNSMLARVAGIKVRQLMMVTHSQETCTRNLTV